MSYSSSFLKSLGISIGAVGIPSLFFYSSLPENPYNSIAVANRNYMEEIGEEMEQSSGENSHPSQMSVGRLNALENNEFCPKDKSNPRRNFQYCALLKGIINILESEIGENFTKKIYLQHPTKPTVKIPFRESLTRTDQDSQEVFEFYYKENPDLKVEGFRNHMINLWHLVANRKMNIEARAYDRWHMDKIRKIFPNITPANYHNWRYKAILKRLFDNREDVVFKPIKLFQYYHIFKDPWMWGLMSEEAQYFYFTSDSKWAGWKDKNYILHFSDALNTYIPKKTR